jgi:hypothetical protein
VKCGIGILPRRCSKKSQTPEWAGTTRHPYPGLLAWIQSEAETHGKLLAQVKAKIREVIEKKDGEAVRKEEKGR